MSAWPPIAQLLPHGEAAIELESLIDWVPGRAVCSMRVDERSRLVADGALETILLLEAMAQAVAAYLGYEASRGVKQAGIGMLAACRSLQVFEPTIPVGTRLEIRVERVRGNASTSRFDCEVARDGNAALEGKRDRVATATLTLVHGAGLVP